MSVRYLEDFAAGQITKTHAWEVTSSEIVEFASRYDPQLMHTNLEAPPDGRFGGLIASGWHTAAVVMRLMVDARLAGDAELLGLGVDELRWPRPVKPGDVLSAEIEVLAASVSRSQPDHGVVRLQVTARNQKGEVVLVMKPNCWIPRRPNQGAEADAS